MEASIKTLIFLISITLLFSCNKSEVGNPLFLNFHSGITLDEYQKLAKENPDLTVSKDATADYAYTIYLKNSNLKTTIHPWFNLNTNGLEQLFIYGQTNKREELEELKKMFLEKYINPTISSEETSIHTFEKSSCFNWAENKKLVRLCIDSLPDSTAISKIGNLEAALAENTTKDINPNTKRQKFKYFFIYYFEIYYIDSELKNFDFNKKTKNAI